MRECVCVSSFSAKPYSHRALALMLLDWSSTEFNFDTSISFQNQRAVRMASKSDFLSFWLSFYLHV